MESINFSTDKNPFCHPDFWIGIDTGVKTGIAVWSVQEKKFTIVETTKIHKAMDRVKFFHDGYDIKVRVEDARLRKWIPYESGREVLQGVGSVKRDASIWEDFLTDIICPHELVPPKNNKTKISKEYFNKITGWDRPSSSHARDAAMLVFGK
jgi:hypothetical protein